MMTRDQLKCMLQMQEALNSKIGTNWREANNDWELAIIVEAVEAIEHQGWKWWKKQEPNIKQVQLELIDIWHFIMSQYLQDFGSVDDVVDILLDDIKNGASVAEFQRTHHSPLRSGFTDFSNMSIVAKLKALVTYNELDTVEVYTAILEDVGLTFDELFKLYVGKNVLNTFRQDNGYAEGTYVKVWRYWKRRVGPHGREETYQEGREDNEVLEDILGKLDSNTDNIAHAIYQELGILYNRTT